METRRVITRSQSARNQVRAVAHNQPVGYDYIDEEYDTQGPQGQSAAAPRLPEWPTKVTQIECAHGVVFALVQSGVCVAFSGETNQRICSLNVSSDEVIQSIFYNRYNDSIVTVSILASDKFNSLKCRTTKIEYIQRRQPDAGFLLSESPKRPGFIEFDDLNGKALTFSA